MSRPDWVQWALGVAKAVAERGDCSRRQVGAVILDSDRRICGAGYNGTYAGAPGCLEGACPRGRHSLKRKPTTVGLDMSATLYPTTKPTIFWQDACSCGGPWPCPDAVLPGSQYDTGPGACIAVHAELNALLDVSERERLRGARMYVTHPPCAGCLKILRNTGLGEIIWSTDDGLGYEFTVWPFPEER